MSNVLRQLVLNLKCPTTATLKR